jgi:hypothetical protein
LHFPLKKSRLSAAAHKELLMANSIFAENHKMQQVIDRTDFNFPGQTAVYHGKVRDVYAINDELLVMVASDRISAFDVILPRAHSV